MKRTAALATLLAAAAAAVGGAAGIGSTAGGGQVKDDSVICAAVNVRTNEATWTIGVGRDARSSSATYEDSGEALAWRSAAPVPRFVRLLARGELGQRDAPIRARCARA